MNESWPFFLGLTLFCVCAEAFFSMFEMACVSFNKLRLQYYVSKNHRRAKWVKYLLDKPSRLFGTTLIVVNTVLQVGSESSRRFYDAIGLSPDLAPITQILIVLLFAELAPMFAARRHPEHVAMMHIPVVYFFSKVLFPLTWFFDRLSHFVHLLFGKKNEVPLFLSREEIQKAFEERDIHAGVTETDEFNTIVSKIFSLKSKTTEQVMVPMSSTQVIPSDSTLKQARQILSVNYTPFIPIYHRHTYNIVAIAYPRDLLRVHEEKRVIDYSKPPWFITKDSSVLQILHQFRRNNQSIAIVLDKAGHACGILTLDQIIDEVFGQESSVGNEEVFSQMYFERTLPGNMKLEDFNKEFHTELTAKSAETLSEYMTERLRHHPAKGEKVLTDQFELVVIEPSLFGAKTIRVRTRNIG